MILPLDIFECVAATHQGIYFHNIKKKEFA